MTALPEPWLRDTVERLDLRPGDRVLAMHVESPLLINVLGQTVGNDGEVFVVGGTAAVEWIGNPAVHVMDRVPDRDESFGAFDAMVLVPFGHPPTASGERVTLAELASWPKHNLRLGGRFAFDLPAERPNDPIHRAWERASGRGDLARLRGPGDDGLAAALRDAGLRRVEASVASHLVDYPSPREVADAVYPLLAPDEPDAPDLCEDFTIALTETLATNGTGRLVLHRVWATGIR